MWSRVPLVRLLIPFVSGLLMAGYYYAATDISLLFILAFPVLAGGVFFRLVYGYRSRWVHGLFLIIFMLGCSYYFVGKAFVWQEKQLNSIHPGEHTYLLRIDEAFEMRERSCRARSEIRALFDSTSCTLLDAGLMLYVEPDSSLSNIPAGSFLLIRAAVQELRPPANPEEFDYKRYLGRKGIFHSVYLKKDAWKLIDIPPEMSLFNYAELFRRKLLDKLIANGIDGKYFGISSALLLGEDSQLDAGIRDVYARAGAMHILCVSGLHVGVIFMVLTTLLGFLKRSVIGRKLLPLLLMACIWSYAFLTGMAPPVSRASCMISFFILGNVLGRHKNVYNTLAASALLMIMIDPQVIYSAGFQLSYSAVLGIISLQKPIENLFYFKYKLTDRIWAITSVSIAAQIGTFPVVLYYFHQVPLYSLITNLIVIPLSSLIIYTGIVLLILPLHSLAAGIVAKGFKFLIYAMDSGVNMVESIPYGMAEGIVLDLASAIMIAMLMCCFSAFAIRKENLFFMLGLVVSLALSLYRLHSNYAVQTQEHLVVYAVRGHSAYDCISGTSHRFYADSALLCAPDKIGYSIAPYWLARHLDNTILDTLPTITLNSTALNLKRSMLNGKCNTIFVWQGPFPYCHPPANRLKADVLILRGKCPFKMEDVFSWFDPGIVIIDSSVPPWVKAPDGDGRFWDVREKGAYSSA